MPGLADWLDRNDTLSAPPPVWQQRLGGGPQSVTIAGNAAIVEHRTSVESRSLASGVQLWQRKVDWAAVAGGASDPVVVVGKLLVKGYEVVDPQSGAVRRRDSSAVAVWTYRNGLLDARCFEPKDCVLTAWDPRGGSPLWTVELPGVGVALVADNPELLGTRRMGTRRVDARAGGPEQMPALLGFPVDGRVLVVDTATGRLLQQIQPDRQERVVVVGGRVLRINAKADDGTCYFSVRADDPANDQQVWQKDGINLRTADGAGCIQRKDPQGGNNMIVGVGPDRREAVIDAYDGRYLWVGVPDENLLAVDDRYALVRSADHRSVLGYELARSPARWSRPADPDGGAVLARYAAIVTGEEPDRIVALDPLTGGELANLRSSAKVLAVGPRGMIIGEGREIGYVPFGAVAAVGVEPAPGADSVPDGGPGVAPSCSGPKLEVCPPDEPKDG
ncbi:MAG TPA: hypothetical protein VF462_00890 [Micromonosporaceae bacterium]